MLVRVQSGFDMSMTGLANIHCNRNNILCNRNIGRLPSAVHSLCQASSNPANTIFDVKRLIGRKYSDATVKADVQLFPFTGKQYSVHVCVKRSFCTCAAVQLVCRLLGARVSSTLLPTRVSSCTDAASRCVKLRWSC